MSTNDWFARKLNPQQPPQQPNQNAPAYVAPQPATYVQPPQPQYPPTQQSTPQAPRCPGCGSSNYGGAQGSRPRCYECGYPIEQSGSGLGKGIVGQGGTPSGPASPSRQVSTGGFNGTTPAIGPDGGFR